MKERAHESRPIPGKGKFNRRPRVGEVWIHQVGNVPHEIRITAVGRRRYGDGGEERRHPSVRCEVLRGDKGLSGIRIRSLLLRGHRLAPAPWAEDGIYFLRFARDEHWLMTGVKNGRVHGRWLANGGGNMAPERFSTAEWSRRYDAGEPEVHDATTDVMGAARNFPDAIRPIAPGPGPGRNTDRKAKRMTAKIRTTRRKTKSLPPSDPASLDCEGYRRLLAAVEKDESSGRGWHDYRGKLAWIVARARHYAEKTGLAPEAILDAWESGRSFWYMNYYQESRQPEIKDGRVRVFETMVEALESIGKGGFRCPACEGVSKSPYECTAGTMREDKPCDWKVYGLFGHMGKGLSVFVKSEMAMEAIFMPVAWESQPREGKNER